MLIRVIVALHSWFINVTLSVCVQLYVSINVISCIKRRTLFGNSFRGLSRYPLRQTVQYSLGSAALYGDSFRGNAFRMQAKLRMCCDPDVFWIEMIFLLVQAKTLRIWTADE
jgi:hypothetical protein